MSGALDLFDLIKGVAVAAHELSKPETRRQALERTGTSVGHRVSDRAERAADRYLKRTGMAKDSRQHAVTEVGNATFDRAAKKYFDRADNISSPERRAGIWVRARTTKLGKPSQ